MSSFKEILAEAGLSDEQVSGIQGQMAENNIHLSNNENVDDRYEKLKGQQADAAGQLEEANKLIKQLQAGAGDAEAAKQQAAEYLARIEEVEAEKAVAELNAAIKIAALKFGAKDADYIAFKLNQDPEKLKLGENGELVNEAELLGDLKKVSPESFKAEETPGIIVNMHNKDGDPADTVTPDQFKKMSYQERVQLKQTNPEQYRLLSERKE